MESWYSFCTVLTILMTLHVHCVLFVNGSELKGYLSRECVEVQSVLDIFSGGGRRTQMEAIENNTAISCLERCKKIQLGIAGVQNNRCYCGDSVNIGKRGRCNTRCPGDKAEVCGGLHSISVVFTSAPQPHGYIGCYTDNLSVLIYGTRHARNSGKYCIRLCMSRSYRYAGTKIKECKCSNSSIMGDTTEAACTIRCPGNLEEICGSKHRISLYDTSIAAAKLTTTTTSKVTIQTTRISQITTTLLQPQQSTRKGKESISSTSVNDKTEASSTFISSGTANTESDTTTTTMTVIYISLPVVAVVVSVTVLVICFILRRKRLKNEPRVKYNGNPSENGCQNADNATDSDSNCSQGNSNAYNFIPNTSQCEQDTAERRKSEDNVDANCSTIFIEPRNSMASNHQYVNLEIQPADSTNTNAIYSHLQTTQYTKEHIYNELIGTS